MIRVLFLALIFAASLTARAQQEGFQPDDTAFISKYANQDFNGKFALTIGRDTTNNYFLLDFSKLPDRFDRVFFMNLSFLSEELVNIDPVVTKNRVCFMSNKKNKEDDVLKLFEDIKNKVTGTSSAWSNEQKSEWLKENDKYK
ncbi:MAG: hypothetical protein NT040_12185 [Bacteroidetes bacterium]|nr:hypothetical protein [Bacteroidota bacterium]